MTHRRLQLNAIFLFIFMMIALQAQESVNVTGGNATSSGGSVSYSVGQVVYSTNTGTSGSMIQGIQQPYVISVVTAIEEARDINLSVSAYPNPVTDNLTLSINEFDISNLSYQLYDINGKLLQSEKSISNQTSIFMKNLLPATYFVKVVKGYKEVKMFKIIKN